MTNPVHPPHDFDAVYAEEHMGEVPTPFRGRSYADGSVVVEGNCPRCHGRTASEYGHGLPGSGTKGLLSWLKAAETAPDIDSDVAVLKLEVHYCECSHPHPNIPSDASPIGCGASWRVSTLTKDDAP
ncbi:MULTISPECIES: hypothetical protein [unclassified Streptomyces]|uniref:hypothetical protein n=1 Tax=unclassified Streptomyces TaxID=2593676 RepID=UPI002E8155EA|nr:hypothetical protein [Streptomyces sp. NBC_00589]WTI40624.1 hypothetical protein OIC96_39320 [Streptomyces sp. NBC_00775]WUB25692.1 hypothetical protein OHA51_10410 [Streptomyces sp. NBC_00589]